MKTLVSVALFSNSLWAQAAGTVVRDVQDRLRDTFSLLDFAGADPTGQTDSSVAIEHAWNAAGNGQTASSVIGAILTIPCGTYKITKQITLTSAFKHLFEGSGGCTTFNWTGNSSDPMFLIQNCFQCEMAHFKVTNSQPLKYVVWQINSGLAYTSIHNRYIDIFVQGGGSLPSSLTLTTAFYMGGGTDGNNDQAYFQDVMVTGASHSAFTLDHSQVFDIVFEHCFATFTNIAVETLKGQNFYWKDGDVAGNFTADFYVSVLGPGLNSIENVRSEGSAQFLTTGPGLGAFPVNISLDRVGVDNSCTGATATQIVDFDRGIRPCPAPTGQCIITFGRPGVLAIRNSWIGFSSAAHPYKTHVCATAQYNNLPPYGPLTFTVEDTTFGTGYSTIHDIFNLPAYSPPSTLLDSNAMDTGTAATVQLGNYMAPFVTQTITNLITTNSTVANEYASNITSPNGVFFATSTGPAVFAGTGLNDAISGGVATSPYPSVYVVRITTTGTPDTFEWKLNDRPFSSPTQILGGLQPQSLSLGLSIAFRATTGHKTGDQWTITVADLPNAPVVRTGNLGYTGTGSAIGPIQCGTATGLFSACIDAGNITSGPVLEAFRDTAANGAFGFANRTGSNAIAPPWFHSHSVFGTNPGGPYAFASWAGKDSCSSSWDGYQDTVIDAESNVPGGIVSKGGGSHHATIQCDGSSGHWFVVGAANSPSDVIGAVANAGGAVPTSGASSTITYVTGCSLTTKSITYKDKSGVNATVAIATGIACSTSTATFVNGLLEQK